jgi:thiamine biosynthesis lipoprotein
VKRIVIFLFLALWAGVFPTGTPAAQSVAPAKAAAPAKDPSSVLRLEESLDSMGTAYSVVVYGIDRYKMQAAVEDAFEEVRRLDRLLSNYRPDSEVSELNKNAGRGPVRVSKEVLDLLSACVRYSEASEGAFDITVGPLMKVWGFYRGSGRFPHRAEIRGALANVGYKNLVLNTPQQTVQYRRSGVEIDPGGIGKGYAVDRMVAILRERGIRSGLITAGSSSIYGIGAPPMDAKGWRVEIKHPKNPSQAVQDVFLKDMSMSTSGNYEKFFRVGGKVYSHIMDPRTGYPAPGMLSVSVVSSKTLDSEAWTKPYFINGRNWAANHKLSGSRVFLCEDRSELACAWLQ